MGPGDGVSELDEDTVVARAQDGDVGAFEELVKRYENKLYRYAYGMLGNRQDAEDALQDTLIRAWRGLPDITTTGAFSGWVYRIMTRRCLDVLARRKAQRTDAVDPQQLPDTAPSHDSVAPPTASDPATATQARQQMEELAALVQRLPPGQRACWLMHEIQHRPYREIAVALSVPESTVRGRLAHARTRLSEGMTSWR